MVRASTQTAHTQAPSAWANAVNLDYVSMTDTVAQTIQSALTFSGNLAHNGHVTQAVNKYTQADTLLLTPRASILGVVEGFLYYDSATHSLKYYNGMKIMGLMTEVLAGQGAGSTTLLMNKGVATVANGGTIPHLLGTTPTGCLLTPNAVQPYAYSYETGAANITVHHNSAGNLTFSWMAWL